MHRFKIINACIFACIFCLFGNNEKIIINKLELIGNHNVSLNEILFIVRQRPPTFFFRQPEFNSRLLKLDALTLKNYYHSKGFLDVKIEQSSVKVNPVGKSDIELVIGVQEGKRSFFGKQTVVGNVSIGTDELMGKGEKPKIKTGEPYSPTLLSEERNRLRKKYGEKGYLDTRVRAIRTPNLTTNQIDLRFEITENNKFTVNSIKVRGNEKTKTIAIIRELALAPGETFDLLRMETSEARLRNTRFFEKVTLDDEPIASQDPELQNTRRNLVVDVKEGRTGHVSFGVGFSTLEKAMMFAEFRQGNFDIMKWRSPHRLQGDGQKFRLRLKLGSRSNEARLALEEPWFLNRRIAAGFEVFREKSDYYSSYYDEMRAGFEIYFRKRLFELVEGRAFYGYEDVLIDDITITIQKELADKLVSKVGDSNYGRISLITNLLSSVSKEIELPPSVFFPKPKVYSSVIKIIPLKNPRFDVDLNMFEKLTKKAFGNRRKMLRQSLKEFGGRNLLKIANINDYYRAQDLSTSEFCKLSKLYAKSN